MSLLTIVLATVCVIISVIACSNSSKPMIMSNYAGKILSPNYPGNYPNNAVCEWLIISSIPDGVSAKFKVFFLVCLIGSTIVRSMASVMVISCGEILIWMLSFALAIAHERVCIDI
jgi:CUB domain